MKRPDGTSWHVLVIDDDRGTRELYRDFLQDEGCRVTLATDPESTPSAIAALLPDLILLDLLFAHERRGLDLLERLKADPATMAIPVLVCSADTRFLDKLHDQLMAWDCGVLGKPFLLDELLAAIESCLLSATADVSPTREREGPALESDLC